VALSLLPSVAWALDPPTDPDATPWDENYTILPLEEAIAPLPDATYSPNEDTIIPLSEITPLAVDLTTSISGTDSYQYAHQVFALLNAERQSAGLAPLTFDDDLTTSAMQRAAEIAVYFNHTRPSGLEWRTSNAKLNTQGGGENIAGGQGTPEAVMVSWMESQGHRENILRDTFLSVALDALCTMVLPTGSNCLDLPAPPQHLNQQIRQTPILSTSL